MSIWYQLKVHAIAKGRAAVAKFFGLDDDWKDVRTDMFEFSFGGKNAPSLTLKKIVQQNPDLIFLVEQHVECDTVEWFVTKWDSTKNEQQFFWIQDFGNVVNKVSKKLLEEYDAYSHELTMKHLEGRKGFENFRWTQFLNDFDELADRLNRAEEYQEMVNPWAHFGVKTYLAEYECDYGCKEDGPFWHKEHQGPMSKGALDALQDRFAKMIAEGTLRNLTVREVEPR